MKHRSDNCNFENIFKKRLAQIMQIKHFLQTRTFIETILYITSLANSIKHNNNSVQLLILTNKKLKSPLENKRYTTNDIVKNPPHIAIFFVWSLKFIPKIL